MPRVPTSHAGATAGAGGTQVDGAPGGANAPGLAPFELSVICAAEIYVWQLYALHERQCAAAGWASPFALTAEEREAEAAQAQAFEKRQQVCAPLPFASKLTNSN